MDFKFSPDQNKLRDKVRDFIKKHPADQYPCEVVDEGWGLGGFSKEYSKIMGEYGFNGIALPKEYGGEGGTLMDLFIVKEEMAYYKVPTYANVGNEAVALALLENGTEEQKRRFLPSICRGEKIFCQGLSEPNAGSDLLSLKTTAVKDGSDYIINGTKIWSSLACFSDWILLAAKTDLDAPNHLSISSFLVDLSSPGITVRPIRDMTGEDSFAEVIFEEVRVPENNLLGELNKGFKQILYALEGDRFWARGVRASVTKRNIEDMITYCKQTEHAGKPLIEDSYIYSLILDLSMKAEICHALTYRTIGLMDKGKTLTHEAAMLKYFADDLGQLTTETWIKILGPASQIIGKRNDCKAQIVNQVTHEWKFAPGLRIAGGTTQIQKNTIASRGLRLPRS